jgi:ribosome biogenesis SPOUT family RNA methylase Rps3
MIVEHVEEHEDGSATVTLTEITKEEQRLLISEGFLSLLRKYLDQEEEKNKTAALLRKPE